MLKGIPTVISPELMYALMSMGHGDEIVIADGNFPAASNAQRLIRADGLGVCELLKAIMKFFPLDTFVEDHAVIMEVADPFDKQCHLELAKDLTSSKAEKPPIWAEFKKVLDEAEKRSVQLTPIERHQFYERSRNAYCIIATSETALYANLILKKGVVT
jgi:L-fucose mutarotase